MTHTFGPLSLLVAGLALVPNAAFAQAEPAESRPAAPASADETTLPTVDGRARAAEIVAHLPEQIGNDILRWYDRLCAAKCIKITMDTDETWTNLWDLDERGVPRLVLRERFHMIAWMTPDMTWLVIYPYAGDAPDTTDPHVQLLWIREEGSAWERVWMPKKEMYRARKYECREPYGPVDCDFYTRGCLHGAVLQSWIARGIGTLAPTHPIHTNGMLRRPNLAQVPPGSTNGGVWLDVFKEVVPRNEEAGQGTFYRRQDFMLLARNELGEPELREWQTRVVTDDRAGGMKPQEILARGGYGYEFASVVPSELIDAARAFRAQIERDITSGQSSAIPASGATEAESNRK